MMIKTWLYWVGLSVGKIWGIEMEADAKHLEVLAEHFGMDWTSRTSATNGEKDDRDPDAEDEELDREERRVFRGLAARL